MAYKHSPPMASVPTIKLHYCLHDQTVLNDVMMQWAYVENTFYLELGNT